MLKKSVRCLRKLAPVARQSSSRVATLGEISSTSKHGFVLTEFQCWWGRLSDKRWHFEETLPAFFPSLVSNVLAEHDDDFVTLFDTMIPDAHSSLLLVVRRGLTQRLGSTSLVEASRNTSQLHTTRPEPSIPSSLGSERSSMACSSMSRYLIPMSFCYMI